jgi:putative toxin-antitoxin system antitoxin component (TIGR02293 family)
MTEGALMERDAEQNIGEELLASILQTKALIKAEEVLGNLQDAQSWMITPALGLDNQTPIALLTTQTGFELVDDFLTRIAHGVYS